MQMDEHGNPPPLIKNFACLCKPESVINSAMTIFSLHFLSICWVDCLHLCIHRLQIFIGYTIIVSFLSSLTCMSLYLMSLTNLFPISSYFNVQTHIGKLLALLLREALKTCLCQIIADLPFPGSFSYCKYVADNSLLPFSFPEQMQYFLSFPQVLCPSD